MPVRGGAATAQPRVLPPSAHQILPCLGFLAVYGEWLPLPTLPTQYRSQARPGHSQARTKGGRWTLPATDQLSALPTPCLAEALAEVPAEAQLDVGWGSSASSEAPDTEDSWKGGEPLHRQPSRLWLNGMGAEDEAMGVSHSALCMLSPWKGRSEQVCWEFQTPHLWLLPSPGGFLAKVPRPPAALWPWLLSSVPSTVAPRPQGQAAWATCGLPDLSSGSPPEGEPSPAFLWDQEGFPVLGLVGIPPLRRPVSTSILGMLKLCKRKLVCCCPVCC